jgi:hypothetical protein
MCQVLISWLAGFLAHGWRLHSSRLACGGRCTEALGYWGMEGFKPKLKALDWLEIGLG